MTMKKLQENEHWIDITNLDYDEAVGKSWWNGFYNGGAVACLILLAWAVYSFN